MRRSRTKSWHHNRKTQKAKLLPFHFWEKTCMEPPDFEVQA
jgi:hypothetical protein